MHRDKRLLAASRATLLLPLIGLAACGGGGSDTPGGPDFSMQSASEACTSVGTLSVEAAAIGLPTQGATITSTKLVAASGSQGEYCEVRGSIQPMDATAPPIKLQANLPSQWNGKMMQFGGGGFDGTVVTGLNAAPNSPSSIRTPLARGYVTFGSDSGHTGGIGFSTNDAAFGLNDEALANYGGDAIKKVHDAVAAIVHARYGDRAVKTYFVGGSKGGQEALAAAQRWPSDYDGVVSYYPAWSYTAAFSAANRLTVASYQPGAYINAAKGTMLFNAVVSACDALDGVADGIVSSPAACHFDPATVRCAGGSDTGDTCLSDAQIAMVQQIESPSALAFPVHNGIQGYPGFPVLSGAQLQGPFLAFFGSSPTPSTQPAFGAQSFLNSLSDGFVKYFVTRDATYDALQYRAQDAVDTAKGTSHQARVQQISASLDASDDISAFARRGGKLLLLHGTADAIVSPRGSIAYHQRVQDQLGAEATRAFMRFFMIPGFGHGYAAPFAATVDSVGALEDWVERGIAPAGLTTADAATARSRPLCEYGSYPKYNGSGNVNAAASFTCTPN